MRFLADENVSSLVTERLRSEGFNVTSVAQMLPGMSDKRVLEAASREGCILITEDRDFGELVVRQKLAVEGVILLESDRLSNVGEAERVSQVVRSHLDRLIRNLVVIEPSRIRIRPLQG